MNLINFNSEIERTKTSKLTKFSRTRTRTVLNRTSTETKTETKPVSDQMTVQDIPWSLLKKLLVSDYFDRYKFTVSIISIVIERFTRL